MFYPKDTVIYLGDQPVEWNDFYVLIEPTGNRRWWHTNGETITLVCQGGITASFKYTDEFYDKYLKNLEPSVESPFKVSEVGE